MKIIVLISILLTSMHLLGQNSAANETEAHLQRMSELPKASSIKLYSQEEMDAITDSIPFQPFVVTPDMLEEDKAPEVRARDYKYWNKDVIGTYYIYNSLPNGELLGHSLSVVLLDERSYLTDKQIIKEIRSLTTPTSDYMFIDPEGNFYTYKGKNKEVDYELDVVYGSSNGYSSSEQSYRYVYMTNKRNGYKPKVKTH